MHTHHTHTHTHTHTHYRGYSACEVTPIPIPCSQSGFLSISLRSSGDTWMDRKWRSQLNWGLVTLWCILCGEGGIGGMVRYWKTEWRIEASRKHNTPHSSVSTDRQTAYVNVIALQSHVHFAHLRHPLHCVPECINIYGQTSHDKKVVRPLLLNFARSTTVKWKLSLHDRLHQHTVMEHYMNTHVAGAHIHQLLGIIWPPPGWSTHPPSAKYYGLPTGWSTHPSSAKYYMASLAGWSTHPPSAKYYGLPHWLEHTFTLC